MKPIFLFAWIAFASCNNSNVSSEPIRGHDSSTAPGTPANTMVDDTATKLPANAARKLYSNVRFKEVNVEKRGENKYRIRGKGQIFEARFGWVVEDGHNELAQGFEDTNAGAPEWGSFDFTVEVKKARTNSVLHLVLFETSAKDGSRVHECPVPLQ
ncbi:MAG TPA: Gmad2 immunoglobulin-like domain-containing protein [Flavisolibacter sp.]|jgi:hypothetical protein